MGTDAETPGRVERRMKETRERIVRVALELFAEKGVEATTIAEIAKAADIGKGTFFTYFPTKEDVCAEFGRSILEQMKAAIPVVLAEGGSAQDSLRRFLLTACEWNQANPGLSRLVAKVFMNSAIYERAEQKNLDGMLEAIRELVRRGQASGELRKGDSPEDVASLMFGMYFSAIHHWHLAGAKDSLPDRVGRGLDILFRGLAP